jgi:hypothetical protein
MMYCITLELSVITTIKGIDLFADSWQSRGAHGLLNHSRLCNHHSLPRGFKTQIVWFQDTISSKNTIFRQYYDIVRNHMFCAHWLSCNEKQTYQLPKSQMKLFQTWWLKIRWIYHLYMKQEYQCNTLQNHLFSR